MSLLRELSDLVGSAFEAAGLERADGEVVVSQRPDLAQFQCNGALAAAKRAGRAPRDIAAEVAATVQTDERIATVTVAGPGFLNLDVTDAHLASWLATTATDPYLGLHQALEPRSVIVDYGGPNVAKDLHVGHLRPALIGESVKRLYLSLGHDAKGDVHLGDWGLPMGQLIAAVEDAHPDLPYFADPAPAAYPDESPVTIEDLQELYPKASARSKSDAEFQERARAATVALQEGHPGYRALWEHFREVSVAALGAVYDALGVRFELWNGEASVADRLDPLVEDLRERGVAVESDGALVIPVAADDDSVDMPPLMLLSSHGAATYALTDLATIAERVEDFDATGIVYVVDSRQALHFTQVFRAARAAGLVDDEVELEHAGNGTVNGPDGKPFRTREGGLPRLGGMIDEVIELATKRLDENDLATELPPAEREHVARLVGLAALKFGELSNHRTTNYSFDLDRFTLFQGRTGPYVQYTTVRTRSILRRLGDEGVEPGEFLPTGVEEERTLALALLRWPEVVERALETHAPNVVAEYAFELAGVFNQFYGACHILTEPDEGRKRSWLALVELTNQLLVQALDLLVIEAPDRM